MRQQSVGLRWSGGARCRRRAGGDRLAPGVLIRFAVDDAVGRVLGDPSADTRTHHRGAQLVTEQSLAS
jgi:hypothetical protein